LKRLGSEARGERISSGGAIGRTLWDRGDDLVSAL
jgi:hypothetical protein